MGSNQIFRCKARFSSTKKHFKDQRVEIEKYLWYNYIALGRVKAFVGCQFLLSVFHFVENGKKLPIFRRKYSYCGNVILLRFSST